MNKQFLHIAIPCNSKIRIHTECLESIKKVVELFGKDRVKTIISDTTLIPEARNRALSPDLTDETKQPLDTAEWYLCWDSDISLNDPKDVQRLIDVANKNNIDVISPAVPMRREGRDIGVLNNCYAAGKLSSAETGYKLKAWTLPNEKGIIKKDWLATSFILIRASVFSKIEAPWFETHTHTYDNGTKRREIPEDLYFCLKCQRAGISTYLYADIKVNHHNSQGENGMEQQGKKSVQDMMNDLANAKLSMYEAQSQYQAAVKQVQTISEAIINGALQAVDSLRSQKQEVSPGPVEKSTNVVPMKPKTK